MNRALLLLARCQGLFLINNVSFIAINALQGIFGRGSITTASAATIKRKAVSCGGVKLSSPILLTTNAIPQMMETRTARKM